MVLVAIHIVIRSDRGLIYHCLCSQLLASPVNIDVHTNPSMHGILELTEKRWFPVVLPLGASNVPIPHQGSILLPEIKCRRGEKEKHIRCFCLVGDTIDFKGVIIQGIM
jgi:hypothetical protein